MTYRIAGGRSERVAVLGAACLVLGLGCFGDDAPEGSGAGMALSKASVKTAYNSPPELRSVRLSPASPAPGDLLEALVEAEDPDNDPLRLGYSWQVDGRRILETGAALRVPELRRGAVVTVSVVATDGESETEPMLAEVKVANRPPRITGIEIEVEEADPSRRRDAAWVVQPHSIDPDGDLVDYEIQWWVNDRDSSIRGDRFEKKRLERGDTVRVRVVASDGVAESDPLESAQIAIGNSPPEILSTPPGLDPSGVFRYVLQVKDHDGDRSFRYTLEEAPEGMTLDPSSREIAWTPSFRDSGDHDVKVSVDDGHGGVTSQSFRLSVRVGAAPASPR